jgi:hypothetical protein
VGNGGALGSRSWPRRLRVARAGTLNPPSSPALEDIVSCLPGLPISTPLGLPSIARPRLAQGCLGLAPCRANQQCGLQSSRGGPGISRCKSGAWPMLPGGMEAGTAVWDACGMSRGHGQGPTVIGTWCATGLSIGVGGQSTGLWSARGQKGLGSGTYLAWLGHRLATFFRTTRAARLRNAR